MDVMRTGRTAAGLALLLDDLGAGYSNLKRILDLHPKIVKLDRKPEGYFWGVDTTIELVITSCGKFGTYSS